MASTIDTTVRLIKTLELIPHAPKKITAKEITERLNSFGYQVVKRSVERDLLSLSRTFPLLLDERRRPYGWSLQSTAPKVDIPTMTTGEAMSFIAVRDLLAANDAITAVVEPLKPYFKTAEQKLSIAA